MKHVSSPKGAWRPEERGEGKTERGRAVEYGRELVRCGFSTPEKRRRTLGVSVLGLGWPQAADPMRGKRERARARGKR